MRASSALAAFAAAAIPGTGNAQCDEVQPTQYAGTAFTNSLAPTHERSEIAYFKIRDPSGAHVCTTDAAGDLSLLTFQSLNTTGGRPVEADLKRAVIVIHGARNDPWNYHAAMIQALELVVDNTEVSLDTVAITAPYFPNDDDANVGFPYNADGATPADQYPSPALVWYDDNWSGGANNEHPPGMQTVSGFDALDQLIQWYGNKEIFPNINQIVVSGHSMGAQMANRFATVGKTGAELGITTPVSYWIGDPNSLVWFSESRPLSTSKCPTGYDDWREGFANYGTYGTPQSTAMTYNAALVAQGRDALYAHYQSQTIAYARASRDKGDYNPDDECATYTTGADRNERFFEFIKTFPATCQNPAGPCQTVDIVNSSHDAPTMFQDVSGRARLFLDNWDGAGSRAYDYGYPRYAEYDDPYPNPEQNNQALIGADSTVYAGSKVYKGCYTDVDNAQSVGALPVSAYVGALNSRTYCSNLCTQQGYTIAGISWENCYCGNAMGSESVEVVETSCIGPCPAAGAVGACGGANRLSVMSSVDI